MLVRVGLCWYVSEPVHNYGCGGCEYIHPQTVYERNILLCQYVSVPVDMDTRLYVGVPCGLCGGHLVVEAWRQVDGLAGGDGVRALEGRAVHWVHGRGAAGLEQCAVVYAVALLEQ